MNIPLVRRRRPSQPRTHTAARGSICNSMELALPIYSDGGKVPIFVGRFQLLLSIIKKEPPSQPWWKEVRERTVRRPADYWVPAASLITNETRHYSTIVKVLPTLFKIVNIRSLFSGVWNMVALYYPSLLLIISMLSSALVESRYGLTAKEKIQTTLRRYVWFFVRL